MRIGIDARMFGGEFTTGIGVYINELTRRLFVLDQQNEYFMFMLDPAFSAFVPPNNRVKKIKVNCRWYSLAEQREMPMILKKYQLDLVHFPHFNVPLLYSGPYLVTIHDITPKFFPGPKIKKSFIRKMAYNLVFKTGLKKSKKIITISNHTKQNLIKYFNADPNKIELVYPGVDEKFQPITDQKLLAQFKVQHQITKPFILYVGVWKDHKNLPGLVQAFNFLKTKHQLDYQLVLATVPDERYPEIQQAINASHFKSDIKILGFMNDHELPLLYSAAELFVLPSFCEGFGLVAAEALACGTPVAGSNTTSLPEVIGAGALYFDPHDPAAMAEVIRQILLDKDMAQQLVAKGQPIIQAYKWDKSAEKILAIFNSCN